MLKPNVSFIMITAREDFPYLNRPDLHVFEPTLESFKKQTNHEFEWIIVDVLYDQRKDYFADKDLPFKVKHIPAKPNLWIEEGFPGISTQYNKGIIYADGELLFFWGDSHIAIPEFADNLWRYYQQGYFPLAWYLYDQTFSEPLHTSEKLDAQTAKEKFKIMYPDQDLASPIPYDILGYTGKKVSIEHRYTTAFKEPNQTVFPAPWLWWFGCSSASLEAMLKINGFNQNFDGDRMLLDCDVGSRLDLAGYGLRLALFKDVFLARIPTDTRYWNTTQKKQGITIKCNYPFIWYARFFKQCKANTEVLTDADIKWIKEIWCAQRCPIRELCKREHPWQYPFEHKAGYEGHNSDEKWFNFWKEHQAIIDLAKEREKRLNGDPKYKEGTFT